MKRPLGCHGNEAPLVLWSLHCINKIHVSLVKCANSVTSKRMKSKLNLNIPHMYADT